jgi:hypothetical protein
MGLAVLVKSQSGTASFTLHQTEGNCHKDKTPSDGAGWQSCSAVTGSAGFEIPMGLCHLSWFFSVPPDQCWVINLLPPPSGSLPYDTLHPAQRTLDHGKAPTLSDERCSRAGRPEGEILSVRTASHLRRLYLSYRCESVKFSFSLLN